MIPARYCSFLNILTGLDHARHPEDGGRAALRRVRHQAPPHPRPQAAPVRGHAVKGGENWLMDERMTGLVK